jgi:L-fuculokinase
LQVKSVEKAIGDDKTDRLYIDGGFSDNDLYVKLLTYHFPEKKVRTTDASLGSALGAAIVISDTKLNSKFLKENYALKKHAPLILN